MMIYYISSEKIGLREHDAVVGFNVPNNFDGVPHSDSHDPDISMLYSQGVDMSPDEMLGTRLGRSSEGRNASSGSKRK